MEPGPGGDPIRNPGVLPTGKNIHALDPQSIPTQAAVKSARIVVERCDLVWRLAALVWVWFRPHRHTVGRASQFLGCADGEFVCPCSFPGYWQELTLIRKLVGVAGYWRRRGRRLAAHGLRLLQWSSGALTTLRPTESPSRRCGPPASCLEEGCT